MNNDPQLIGGFSSLDNRQESRGGVASKIQFTHTYQDIISVENLLDAWKEFIRGKRKRKDVQEFERHLLHNILDLHHDLVAETYTHGPYDAFKINDPKPRDIHKASVRDRLLHHALYRQLYPFFDRTFIADSYSCRLGKGTHRAMNTFRKYAYRESKNHTKTIWVLKCDIRKFFASIDQTTLKEILRSYIPNQDILHLLDLVISSFCSTPGVEHVEQRGLPLGNLTSQLLVNIYMNEFDQFAKHTLKAKCYVRYADDFVFLSTDRNRLVSLLPRIREILKTKLKLGLHPNKVSISTLASGVDFLGWVHFPDHRVLRTAMKRRMFRAVWGNPNEGTVFSYRGMLSHGNAWKLSKLLPSSD